MQGTGVEPGADDGAEPVELDDFGEEAEAEQEVDLGEEVGEEPEVEGERPPPQRQRRPGREERRTRELRELRERVERQERELQGVRGQVYQQPRVDPAEQARREASEREQVMLLAPEQQIAYWRDKDRREFSQALVNQQIQVAETLDRQTWDGACRSDAVRARFADRVEQTLSSERQAGRNPSRETIFRYLYGEDALRQRDRQTARQRQQGADRVRSQTTQPGNGRSDVARERQPGGDSIEAARRRISGRPLW